MFRFGAFGRMTGFVVAALLLGGHAVGAADDGGTTTLTFANWAAAEATTKPAIDKVIKDFEAAHPDIRIKSEAISFSEIARQLVLRVRAGNPPDVAQVAGNDTFLLAATRELEPLGTYVDAALEAQMKPATLAGVRYKDQLIAFPWTQAPAGFWYNKTVMAKAGLNPDDPPKTIDALMEAMAAIKSSQPDVIPLALDTTNRAFAMQSNWPWMEAFGARPMGEGSPGADTPEMKSYLSWMRELSGKGYIDPGRKIGEFRPLAAQDKVAFIWDQVLLQGVIQKAGKIPDAEFYQRWGVTTQPTGPGGASRSFEGGHQLVMFADSRKKEAAWTFIRYLATSPEAIGNYTIAAGSSLAPLAELPDAQLVQKMNTPVVEAFTSDIIPTLTAPPYGPAFARSSNAIMAGVQKAVTGSEPIEEIAATIQKQVARQ